MVKRNNKHHRNVRVAMSKLYRSAMAVAGAAPRFNSYAATAAALINVRDFGAKGAIRDGIVVTRDSSVSQAGLIHRRVSALANSRCSLRNLLCIIRKVIAPP